MAIKPHLIVRESLRLPEFVNVHANNIFLTLFEALEDWCVSLFKTKLRAVRRTASLVLKYSFVDREQLDAQDKECNIMNGVPNLMEDGCQVACFEAAQGGYGSSCQRCHMVDDFSAGWEGWGREPQGRLVGAWVRVRWGFGRVRRGTGYPHDSCFHLLH